MDEPPPGTPDELPRTRRLTRRRLALIVLLPLAVIAGGSGVYVASRGGLLVVPPRATAPPEMTPSPLVGPSGPLATSAASSDPSGAASGSPSTTSVLPTLVPPGSPGPSVAPSASAVPTPSGPPAPPPSIQPPPTAFTDQGTYRGDLQASSGDVALETLAKFAGPKSIVANESTLAFTSTDTWIAVQGQLDATGAFVASGTGTYAGVDNVRVKFEGRITAQLLVGSYEVGVGGGLPGGASITYQFAGARVDPPAQAIPEGITTFLARYTAAVQQGDVETLVALLHPLVIQRYGVDQCRATIAGAGPDPGFAIQPTGVSGPGTWLFAADGTSTDVRDAYTVAATVTAIGATDEHFLHFGWAEGGLRWFTDCGTPIG